MLFRNRHGPSYAVFVSIRHTLAGTHLSSASYVQLLLSHPAALLLLRNAFPQGLIAPYFSLGVWTFAAFKVGIISPYQLLPTVALFCSWNLYSRDFFSKQAALATSHFNSKILPAAQYVYCRGNGEANDNL